MSAPTLPKNKADFLRHVIRPLVRLCFRNACSAYEVIEAVKAVFIELATEEIKSGGNKITTSRVSMMTGIDRRDVKRISAIKGTPAGPPSLVTRVLGQWEQDKRFCTRANKPRTLSYKGEDSEFKRLVASVSTDMNPATMLFELQRLGLVEREEDEIKLVKTVNESESDPEKKLAMLSRNFETLGLSAEENIFESPGVKNLHMRTEFDNIFADDLPKVRKWLQAQGAAFHKKARTFLARYDKDLNRSKEKAGNGKVALVAFSWTSKTN